MLGVPVRMGIDDRRRDLAAVGLAHQQHRKRPVSDRPVHVGVQPHAVAREHGDGFGWRDLAGHLASAKASRMVGDCTTKPKICFTL